MALDTHARQGRQCAKPMQLEKPRKHDRIVTALYALSARAGTGMSRYRTFRRWLGWLTRRSWMHQTRWRREMALVKEFFRETGLHVPHRRHVIAENFLNNRGDTFWERMLDECPADAFERVLTVHGFGAVERVHAQQQATIFVHYHGVFTPLFWTLLRHRGLDGGTVIGQVKQRLVVQNIAPTALNSDLEHTRHLHMARRTLAKGGTVHILPDGYRGNGGIVLPFHGRARTFRTGFAELALMTDAAIVPVFVSSLAPERFAVEVHEPLDAMMGRSHADKVEGLVRQYALALEKQWANAPTNIKWSPMFNHLQEPRSSQYQQDDEVAS